MIWIFCIAKYPEILQPIMNLMQKLSGFAKTFRSALLTRWRGFCDSVSSKNECNKFERWMCEWREISGHCCVLISYQFWGSSCVRVGASQRNVIWWKCEGGEGSCKYLIILTIPHLCHHVHPRNLWGYHLGYLQQKSQAFGNWDVVVIAKMCSV